MSKEETAECRGTFCGDSMKAILVADKRGKRYWIPRSLIAYMRKTQIEGVTHLVFTLPEWFVEKEQLWDLVP